MCQFLSVSFEVVPFTDFVNSFIPSFMIFANLLLPGERGELRGEEWAPVAESIPWGPLAVITGKSIIFKRYVNFSFPSSACYVVYMGMT